MMHVFFLWTIWNSKISKTRKITSNVSVGIRVKNRSCLQPLVNTHHKILFNIGAQCTPTAYTYFNEFRVHIPLDDGIQSERIKIKIKINTNKIFIIIDKLILLHQSFYAFLCPFPCIVVGFFLSSENAYTQKMRLCTYNFLRTNFKNLLLSLKKCTAQYFCQI